MGTSTKPGAGKDEIEVLGAIVRKSEKPEVYRLAVANKAELEKTVRAMMAAQGFQDDEAGSAMAILESDLQGQ